MQSLELLLLKLIDHHPRLKDAFGLTGFFAKTSILPDRIYKTLDKLIEKEWTSVHSLLHSSKEYSLTEAGKEMLKKHYNINDLKKFLLDIDPAGFIINMLKITDGDSAAPDRSLER